MQLYFECLYAVGLCIIHVLEIQANVDCHILNTLEIILLAKLYRANKFLCHLTKHIFSNKTHIFSSPPL